MAEIAVLAGLVMAWSPQPTAGPNPSARAVRSRVALCGLLAVGTLVLAVHAVPGGWLQNAPRDPSVRAATTALPSH